MEIQLLKRSITKERRHEKMRNFGYFRKNVQFGPLITAGSTEDLELREIY